MMKFTADEDNFLKQGVNCHGYGQSTAILRDSDFKFQEGRTADSPKKWAGLKMPQVCVVCRYLPSVLSDTFEL